MRLGVFGGTFDPIHEGHLATAAALTRRFRFDRFLFVPADIPPHKRSRKISNPGHRSAMIALAIAHEPSWLLSTIELDCAPPHYTVDTVARFHERYPEARPLYFVMGADSFEDLASWHDYLRLVDSCHIIVTARPGYELETGHLPESARERIVDLRSTPPNAPLPEPGGESTRIFWTADALVDVSSTEVRRRAREGEPLEGLVPEAVADYIRKQELYSDRHE